MTRSPRAAVLALVIACGCARDRKPADDCQIWIDKAWHLLPELAPTETTKEQFLSGCRRQLAAGEVNPTINCVVTASGDDEVRSCIKAAQEEWEKAALDQFTAPLGGEWKHVPAPAEAPPSLRPPPE
jgi:hypothetical protein